MFKITVKFSDGFADMIERWNTRKAAERAIEWFHRAAKEEGTWTVISAEIEEIHE